MNSDSQMIGDNEINTQLIEKFKDYKEEHILTLINELRKYEILSLRNSMNGWTIFVRDYIIHEIKEIIHKQTLLAKQKLSFIQCYNSLQLSDYQIPELICNILDPNLVIIKKDEL